jgi:hypothetical protein
MPMAIRRGGKSRMGVSETIVAAMIGAMATVTTALFQIFGGFGSRSKVDTKPRRGVSVTLRSMFAVFVLMIASAAGGFLYSELLKQRHSEDIRAMRAELKELKDLTASAARNSNPTPSLVVQTTNPAPTEQPVLRHASLSTSDSSAESVVYVPACRAQVVGAQCEEVDAQRIALCGTIPSYAQVRSIDLFMQPDAVQNAWDQHRVLFEQDLGGAKFVGKSFEYAQGSELKAVCVNFTHWSSEHPHIARLLVSYGFGEPATPQAEPDTSFDALEPTTLSGPGPAVVAAEKAEVM